MSKDELGRLEKVELREFWESEATDFTPWLAKEENIALLGETIGIELEVEAQEKKVGPFKADILCRETTSDHWVLIENQLERTDHTHLGQLLTYAAGLNAVTIVWIADRFTDEHRAALDWLNEITNDTFNFFGLEVELWRIGESPLAPKFNIISKPNDWSRIVTNVVSRIESGDLSEKRKLQYNYWISFSQLLIRTNSVVRPQKPTPKYWMNFAIGRSYFWLTARLNTKDKIASVGLGLRGPDAKPNFFLLLKEKSVIEEEMGGEVEWREKQNKKHCYIMLNSPYDTTNDEQLEGLQQWMKDKLELLHKVFADRIRQLDASEYQEDE